MTAIQGFRNRAQISELAKTLDNALSRLGSHIAHHGNSRLSLLPKAAFSPPHMLQWLKATTALGVSAQGEAKRLKERVKILERDSWKAPVTCLDGSRIGDIEAFRVEKASALLRFERTPAEVTEGFITANGSVNGQSISTRDIFWQRWAARGPASGRVIVISPGFHETGRHFYEHIALLNDAHHDVVVMDHQWAGHTMGGVTGGVDRGFGVARDLAAVAAFAQVWADHEYQEAPHEVILLGSTLGAGPGVLGASLLNEAGLLVLEGPAMPKGMKMILESPYLELTPSVMNHGLAALARLPFVGAWALGAMTAAETDLKALKSLLNGGLLPSGRVYVIHKVDDPLAHFAPSQALVHRLGSEKAFLHRLERHDRNLLDEHSNHRHLIAALDWLTAHDG